MGCDAETLSLFFIITFTLYYIYIKGPRGLNFEEPLQRSGSKSILKPEQSRPELSLWGSDSFRHPEQIF